jgi:hypothetical protein
MSGLAGLIAEMTREEEERRGGRREKPGAPFYCLPIALKEALTPPVILDAP